MFSLKPKKKKVKSGFTHVFYGNQHVRTWKTRLNFWDYFIHIPFVISRFVVSLVIVAMVVVYFAPISMSWVFAENPEPIERIITVREVDKNLEAKVVELQNEVLEELAHCESGTTKEPDGAVILDTNKEVSIGRYMYQRDTVIYYYKELYGEDIGRREAIEISVDPERSTELTRDILFEEGGWKNWANCANAIGLAQKVAWINSLER